MKLPSGALHLLEEEIAASVTAIQPVAGGDIHMAYRIESSRGPYFLKTNCHSQGGDILEKEKNSLKKLAQTGSVRCPRVVGLYAYEDFSFLVLQYIQNGQNSPKAQSKLGLDLAKLHANISHSFGFVEDNHIGRLPQSNICHDLWSDFYAGERILPQVKMAVDNHYLNTSVFSHLDKLFKNAEDIFPREEPALIHGDLWSGNYLIDIDEIPWLIDPCVYYGHREMDLAMSRLFGGFNNQFYRAYEGAYPLEPGFNNRLELYQLYYLLAHVNMFGHSYVPQVMGIIKRFS